MKFSRSLFKAGLTLYTMLFFAFIYIPLVLIAVYSFNANPVNMMVWSGFTTEWYAQVLGFKTKISESALYIESTDQLVATVFNSLKIAASTTAVLTVLGTAIAIAMHRYNFLGKRFYQVSMFMPMLMPDIVLGIALLIFFVNAGIHLGMATIIIGQCTFLISYVFIVVSARLAGMDRTLVAVGTVSDWSMLATSLAAGPRNGTTTSSSLVLPGFTDGVSRGVGDGLAAPAGAAGVGSPLAALAALDSAPADATSLASAVGAGFLSPSARGWPAFGAACAGWPSSLPPLGALPPPPFDGAGCGADGAGAGAGALC